MRLRLGQPRLRVVQSRLHLGQPRLRRLQSRLHLGQPRLRRLQSRLRLGQPRLRRLQSRPRLVQSRLRVVQSRPAPDATASAPAATARFILGVQKKSQAVGRFALRDVNGLPALVAEVDSKASRWAPRYVVRCEIDDAGKIRELHLVIASAKLSAIAPLDP
jgi:hypothetical protein